MRTHVQLAVVQHMRVQHELLVPEQQPPSPFRKINAGQTTNMQAKQTQANAVVVMPSAVNDGLSHVVIPGEHRYLLGMWEMRTSKHAYVVVVLNCT